MITVYQILKESGVKFNKVDCARIGALVYKTIPPIRKIEQSETYNGRARTYHVCAYPDDIKDLIQETSIDYFSKKYLIYSK